MPISGTVPVSGPIAPQSELDTYPTHQSKYGKGGLRTVATLIERDSIPTPRREAGMQVYVTADGKTYQLGNDLTSWTDVSGSGTGPIFLADGGTLADPAIQFEDPNTGFYYNPAAINYTGTDRAAFGVSFDGKQGPALGEFFIWLPVRHFEPNVNDASASIQLIFGPLETPAGGVWFQRSSRVVGEDAAGKSNHCLFTGYQDVGAVPVENWMVIARDFPARPAVNGYQWTEASRSFIDLGAQRPDTRVVVPGGSLTAPGFVFHNSFFKAGLADTGLAALAANEFSAICEGVEVIKFTRNGIDLGTIP